MSDEAESSGETPTAEIEASLSRTDWHLIREAVSGDEQQQALERLARRYWPAIYGYIRATGRDVDAAADLSQGFVCDVMLGRRLFDAADPERGRFRSLLLASVKNYLHQAHRRATAKKRRPEAGAPIPLEGGAMAAAAVDPDRTPEAEFTTQWAGALVRRVLATVQVQCRAEGLEPHWEVFEARIVQPRLFGGKAEPYTQLVQRLHLQDAAQAANMMVTVKRRFAAALLAETAGTVANPARGEEELASLLRDLEQ